MKKIPTIFLRNPENRAEILNEPHPGCGWVFRGEGAATRKYDGTCCLILDDVLLKRREVKKGKIAPVGFLQADHDEVTGKAMGWVPVLDTKENKYHIEGLSNTKNRPPGTYELIGPKIQGNPEKWPHHVLLLHADMEEFDDVPRYFDGIMGWLQERDIEGVVFHHPDGRMAKIKKRDFGLPRVP